MDKFAFLKRAQEENQQILVKTIDSSGTKVYKVKDQNVYLIALSEGNKNKWWLVSNTGVVTFDNAKEAFDSFFGVIKVSSMMTFIRKSSYNLLKQQSRKKLASVLKTAICYDNDAWIDDPEKLICNSNKELWAITKSGKFVARLFDDSNFPLEV